MASDPAELVTLRMTARIWSGIDAGVDNAVSMAVVDGPPTTVSIGEAIRSSGWDQVPWVDGEWPPMDQTISIRLTRAEWRFAAEQAVHDLPIYQELEDEESAQLCRDALAVIAAAGLTGTAHPD